MFRRGGLVLFGKASGWLGKNASCGARGRIGLLAIEVFCRSLLHALSGYSFHRRPGWEIFSSCAHKWENSDLCSLGRFTSTKIAISNQSR